VNATSASARLIRAGFNEEQTGGGCLAYVRPTDDGRVEVVTLDDGPMLGVYTASAWERGEEPESIVMLGSLEEATP
jgi:hypothetical protein